VIVYQQEGTALGFWVKEFTNQQYFTGLFCFAAEQTVIQESYPQTSKK